ncbi:recombinase RecT [Nocardia sp. NPDC051570]|uniref:recombinase RecT n=1 Tax=Nocardia sp. NPDC051570 TaxID=3364324 RepID=UPI0037A86321
MSEITKAVATQQNPLAVVARYKRELGTVLPTVLRQDPDRWLMAAENAARKNPDLMAVIKADQGASYMRALVDCARLGHEPGSKDFYFIKRGNAISGEESYRGVIKRILNSGFYRSVVARAVFERDEYSFDPLTDIVPNHVPAEGDRGKPVSAYAFGVHWDGTPSTVAEATPERIATAKAKSFGADKPSSPWQMPTGIMFRKTAIKELEPYVHVAPEPQPRRSLDGDYVGANPTAVAFDLDHGDVLDITEDQIAEAGEAA